MGVPVPFAARGLVLGLFVVLATMVGGCAGTKAASQPPPDAAEILARLTPEQRKMLAKDAFLEALWLDLQGQGMMAMDLLQEAAWSDPDDRWLQFALAEKLREFRRSPEAFALVRRALTLPGEETAEQWGLAAGLWLEAGGKDSAREAWKRMLALDPEAREALLGLASLAETRGELPEAARFYSRLADQYGQNGAALTNRSVNLWVKAGYLDSATTILDRRWQTWKSPDDGANLARLLATRGLVDSAVGVYDSLAEAPESEPMTWRLLAARTLMLSGKPDAARLRLQALSLQGFVEAQLTLGALLIDLDSSRAARPYFEPHANDPVHGAIACHYLGLIALREDRLDTARTWFDRSLEKDPKRPDTWSRRGLLELDAGDPDSATRIFERMAKLWPGSAQARWLLGHALVRQADRLTKLPTWMKADSTQEPVVVALRRRALSVFDTAIGLDPMHPRARFERAALLERLARRKTSIESFRALLSMDSTNAVAANYLAYMLAEDSLDIPEADRLVASALSADSTSPAYLDTRAWVRYRQGRYEEALLDVEKAISLGEDDPVVLEHRALILERIGSLDARRAAWKALLEKTPEHPRARDALEALR
jgi:tetratricopeptide (TPR) repeat protein